MRALASCAPVPALRFTDECVTLFHETGRDAPDSLNSGRVARWEGPLNGAHGPWRVDPDAIPAAKH
jgi:hypothetical protein